MERKAKRHLVDFPEPLSRAREAIERYTDAIEAILEKGMSPEDLQARFEVIRQDHEGMAATPEVVLRLTGLIDALTAEANKRLGLPTKVDAEFERLCRNIHSAIVTHVAAGKDCSEIATRFQSLLKREIDNRSSRGRLQTEFFIKQAKKIEKDLLQTESWDMAPSARQARDFDRVQKAIDDFERSLGQSDVLPSDVPRFAQALREMRQRALVALRPSFELSESVANQTRLDNLIKWIDTQTVALQASVRDVRPEYDEKMVAQGKALAGAREAVQRMREAAGQDRGLDLSPVERRLEVLEEAAKALASTPSVRPHHIEAARKTTADLRDFRGWADDIAAMIRPKSNLTSRAQLRFQDATNAIDLVELRVMGRLQSSTRISPVVLDRLRSAARGLAGLREQLLSASCASRAAKSQGEEMIGVKNSADRLLEELDGLDEASPDNLKPVDHTFVAFVDFVQYLLPLGAELVRIVMEEDGHYRADFKTAAGVLTTITNWQDPKDADAAWRITVGGLSHSSRTFAAASAELVEVHRKKYEPLADAVGTFDFGKDDGEGEGLGEAGEEGEES